MTDRPLMTEQEAADSLGLSVGRFKNLGVPFVQISPSIIRYDPVSLETWRVHRRDVVYFILSYCSQYVKIGFAANLEKRFSVLQLANPEPLEVLGTIPGSRKRERELHHDFDDFHVRGEWFRFDPYLEEEIYELLEEATV